MYMNRGELLPDDVMINIILDRLKQDDCASRGWLLDGFPRTATQAAALARANISCDVFIHLDVPDEILVERVVGRRSDPETGKIYHMKYSPPESDEIQARLVQRSDDTEEKVAVRIAAFHENLSSILDQYTDVTLKVDGNRSPKVIWAEIRGSLDRRAKNEVVFVLGGPGSGKSTQCARLCEESGHGAVHLSAGDLLVVERETGSPLSAVIQQFTEQGRDVPPEITGEWGVSEGVGG